MDIEQQLDWGNRADEIVAEAAKQNGVVVPELLASAIAQSVRVHGLSQPGVFTLVEAYANCERQAGRLPMREPDYSPLKD